MLLVDIWEGIHLLQKEAERKRKKERRGTLLSRGLMEAVLEVEE